MPKTQTFAEPTTFARISQRRSRLLFVLVGVNIGFASASLTLWTFLRLIVAEPMNWATLSRIGPRPELLEYPFILLWLVPLTAACGAWVTARTGMRGLARVVAALPIMIFAMVMGWFYLTPPAWH